MNVMTPNRESLMLPAVCAHLAPQYKHYTLELPFYEHRIDLYAYSAELNRTVAVELKLRRWRRALEQALLYQLCSDYTFIAVPESTARRIDLEELRRHGIGLLSVSGPRCMEQLPAAPSLVVNPNYRAAHISIMRD